MFNKKIAAACLSLVFYFLILNVGCSSKKSDELPQKGIYNHDSDITLVSLAQNGDFLIFAARDKTKQEKYSLIFLNNMGEKIWEYKDLDYVADLKIAADGDSILVTTLKDPYNSYKSPTSRYTISLLTRDGKLLWSQNIWGIPYFAGDGKNILISSYIKRISHSWDASISLPSGCVDPNIKSFSGEIVFFYYRGKTIFVDPKTGKKLKEENIVGLEKISLKNNYFASSCTEKTILYSKTFQQIFETDESGSVDISPDERYMVICKELKDNNKIIVYDLTGKLLWQKELSWYPGKCLTALSDGFLAVISARLTKTKAAVEDLTLNLFDETGKIIWSKKEIHGFPVSMVAATKDGKYIAVAASKKIKVKEELKKEAREILQREFGVSEVSINKYISKIYLLNYKGEIIWKSKDEVLEAPLNQLATDLHGKYVAARSSRKILFCEIISERK
jgi:hypothetical protein